MARLGRSKWNGMAGKLAFAAAYTATALPFTAAFYTSFLSPPEGTWRILYTFGLPAFLAALEYAGVSLAVLFWRERKAELVFLFAACQALAVASAYYDARSIEWGMARKAREGAVAALGRREGDRAKGRDRLRSSLERRLAEARSDAAGIRRQIENLSLAPSAKPGEDDPFGSLEEKRLGQRSNSLAALRQSLAQDAEEIASVRKSLAALDPPSVAVPTAAGLPGTDAPSVLAYVGETAFSGGSFAALLLALLFPTTVLAMARVIASGEAPPGPAASVDLRRELEEGADLPANRHDSYAALLEPVLAAHVASLRATRGAAARGLGLHLDLAADLDVLESVASLKGQIEDSRLSPSAKARLAAFADRLLMEDERTSTVSRLKEMEEMPDIRTAASNSPTMPPKMDPAVIFKKIDEVREGMRHELEPSLLEKIFSADKRQQAHIIAEAKSSAIKARKELIDGLAGTIQVYVDVHLADLKLRGEAHVMATFAELLKSLNRVNEATIVSFVDTYSVTVDRIRAIPNLTDEHRENQIARARARADRAQDRGEESFDAVLDKLTAQVIRLAEEIGSRG